MRYKVKMMESVEFVIEGKSEDEIIDWMQGNTIRELRMINPSINVNYDERIVEKTVFPADVTTEDFCEDIVDDDWNNRNTEWLENMGD